MAARHAGRRPSPEMKAAMPDPSVLRWQNKTIAAGNDFRGVLAMGLIVAWCWFAFQLFSLPGFADVAAGLSPLLRFVLAKGRYMPDFGLIIAGFAAFHFRREFRLGWDRPVALRLYGRLALPLAGYALLSFILFEAIMALAGHRLVLPWANPLSAPACWILATVLVALALLPSLLSAAWTVIPDVGWAGIAICIAFFGLSFQEGFHHYPALWPLLALFDFTFGVCVCGSLFRAVEYLAAVRGPAIILGWCALAAGSILAGPALLFVGFTMIIGGMAVGERGWYLVGERSLRAWSRTALAIALVQPAVLAGWVAWGHVWAGSLGVTAALLALATQCLACLLYAA
ncbi:MAG TPA: hypothetical protein VHY20_06815, partial [Pirellulales bacterium]|nr:hypothetical protein [Pirellulales bacterium]